MALAEVQAALARLFTDAGLRSRFFADPLAVARSLDLDDREAADLAGLSPSHVSQFAASLRRKRVDDARKFLPLTARALGDAFAPILLAAIDGPALPGRHRDDARALVEHLTRSATTGLPWLADLARYELASREVTTGLRVRRYRYPVGRIARSIHRGEPVADPDPRPTIGLWLRLPGSARFIHRLW